MSNVVNLEWCKECGRLYRLGEHIHTVGMNTTITISCALCNKPIPSDGIHMRVDEDMFHPACLRPYMDKESE